MTSLDFEGSISSTMAPINVIVGDRARIVPSTVTRARDSKTTSPGNLRPSRERVATNSCITVVDRARPRPDVLGKQPPEGPLQLFVGGSLGTSREQHDGLPQQADVATGQGDEHVDDRPLLDRSETAHRTEVDEAEAPVIEGEDVPWVRVGVEEATLHHLIDRRGQELTSELLAVFRFEFRCVGDRRAVEALLHEDPAGAEPAVTQTERERRSRVPARWPSRASRRPRGGSPAPHGGSWRTARGSPDRSSRPNGVRR